MNEKLPWYPLYAADFETDTGDWENEEIGIYVRLLNHEWINGHIPNDQNRLATISRTTPGRFKKKWKKISKKFHQNGDENLFNPKLEKIRKQQADYRKKQVESGRKGAKARWGRQ